MYDDFDRHTRRAVLRLYRSLPDVAAAGETLAAALRPLDRPALVLWGRHDPYLPATLAPRQRDAFPHAEVHVLERSGHWPFVDDPATVAAATDASSPGTPEPPPTPTHRHGLPPRCKPHGTRRAEPHRSPLCPPLDTAPRRGRGTRPDLAEPPSETAPTFGSRPREVCRTGSVPASTEG